MTDPEQGGNRRTAIAGLAIAVALLGMGLWLAHELTATSKMQDCLMSGRTNCNVIETPSRWAGIFCTRRQDRHSGKDAICTAGTIGILIDLLSRLSVYNCPATNITAANTTTSIALANWETSLIRSTNITDAGRIRPGER
jgi:hypothetical protein